MKVVFDFSAQQIAIDGDAPQLLEVLALVRELAPEISHIQISAGRSAETRSAGNANGAPEGSSAPVAASAAGKTLRQFAKQFSFQNMSERIAVVAYYYKIHENRDGFSPKEMGAWFTFAAFQKPSQMPVAMFDAGRKHGYVEKAGHGIWKLTTQGENLVTGKLREMEHE